MPKKKYPRNYKSAKIPNGVGKCRSPMEEIAFKQLDADSEVISYTVEPFAIPYEFEGRQYNYIPDVLVIYRDDSIELIEIKPIHQVGDERNIAKFISAKKYAVSQGYKFKIWVIRGVGHLSRHLHVIQHKYDDWETALEDWKSLQNTWASKRKAQETKDKIKVIIQFLIYLLMGIIFWYFLWKLSLRNLFDGQPH